MDSHKKRCGCYSRNSFRFRVDFLSPCSAPPHIPKSPPILEKYFPWACWVLAWYASAFWMSAFLCRSSKTSQLTISVATQPSEHRFNDLHFPGQKSTPDPLCARAAKSRTKPPEPFSATETGNMPVC